MSAGYVIAGILGLALLMVVHEAGHLLAARAFGMRVLRFSIGFGPPLFRYQARGSDTVYQVALIPFLAYVQIAGMNPFEEHDPEDKGSYANASLVGRISAIVAGPLANYFFASILFFAALLLGGKQVETTHVEVIPGGAAEAAGLQDGDKVVQVAGTPIDSWEKMRTSIFARPNEATPVVVDRGGQSVTLTLTPRPLGKDGGGLIGVRPQPVAMPVGEAVERSVVQPAAIVALTVKSIYRMVRGEEDAQLTGPLGIMRETEKAAEMGLPVYLSIIGFLSTSVGFFNLLPLPALDGGRLLFLAYEAITRRRPNQKMEAQIHAFGMLLLLAAIALVSLREWRSDKTPSEEAAERARAAEKAKEEKARREREKNSVEPGSPAAPAPAAP